MCRTSASQGQGALRQSETQAHWGCGHRKRQLILSREGWVRHLCSEETQHRWNWKLPLPTSFSTGKTSLGPWQGLRLQSWGTTLTLPKPEPLGAGPPAPLQSLLRTCASWAPMRGVYSRCRAPGWPCYRGALRDLVCLCACVRQASPAVPRGGGHPQGQHSHPGVEGSVEKPLAEIFVAFSLTLSFQKSLKFVFGKTPWQPGS